MTLKTPQRACGPHSPDTCPLALHWAFAMTLDLGGHHVLIQRNGFSDDELARELGLGEMIYQDEAFRPARALARLRRERQLFAKAFTAPDYPPLLGENLAALGSLLGLNAGEQRLLGFCVLLHGDPILSAAADQLGGGRIGIGWGVGGEGLLQDIVEAERGGIFRRRGANEHQCAPCAGHGNI